MAERFHDHGLKTELGIKDASESELEIKEVSGAEIEIKDMEQDENEDGASQKSGNKRGKALRRPKEGKQRKRQGSDSDRRSGIKKQTAVSLEKRRSLDVRMARRRKLLHGIKIGIATLIAAFFAILFLMPIVLTISNSFMSAAEIASNYGTVFATNANGGKVFIAEQVNLKFIPDRVSFSQYITVLFKSPEYLLKFWNSVILVGPIVLFQLIVATLAAFGFARYTGKLRAVIFFFYVILMLMPYQVTLVPNYLVSSWLHILDTYWSIWLPGIFSPFAVYLLTKFMKRIPESMVEAAQIDGAGEWQIYRLICMPLCKGAICSAAILVFIDYWNMVEQPLILLADVEKHPLSVFLSKINSGEVGLAFAVATIYMVPTLLVFLYGEEYLVDGITYQGGVKG